MQQSCKLVSDVFDCLWWYVLLFFLRNRWILLCLVPIISNFSSFIPQILPNDSFLIWRQSIFVLCCLFVRTKLLCITLATYHKTSVKKNVDGRFGRLIIWINQPFAPSCQSASWDIINVWKLFGVCFVSLLVVFFFSFISSLMISLDWETCQWKWH